MKILRFINIHWVFVLVMLMAIKIIDWSWIRGEITGYSEMCMEWSENKSYCKKYEPISPNRYRPDKVNEVVYGLDQADITKYTKCDIIDRKNWKCLYNEENGEFGFSNGNYFFRDLNTTDISKLLAVMPMTRFEWLIGKGVDCRIFFPACFLLAGFVN